MRTQAWDLSVHSVHCHEFDILCGPREWVTSRQHVWMLATVGQGLYYRRGREIEPLPVGPPGMALHYLPPGTWRFVKACSPGPLHLVVLRLCLIDDAGRDLLANYLLPEQFPPKQEKRLSVWMQGILAQFDDGALSSQAEIQRLLAVFLGTLLESAATRPDEAEQRHPSRCQKAVAYLLRNYAEELDIDHLAQLCCVSRPHFFRLFREETGMTAQQYLCQIRLDHARTLLRFSDRSVAEVGRAVGWRDPFHFSRLFTRETGCCPSEFRNRDVI